MFNEGCLLWERRPPPFPERLRTGAPRASPRAPRQAHSARSGQRPAVWRAAFGALGRAAAAAALFAVSLTLHLWFSSSALRWSVRQALSSVGSHFRVNIISDGHNRLE